MPSRAEQRGECLAARLVMVEQEHVSRKHPKKLSCLLSAVSLPE